MGVREDYPIVSVLFEKPTRVERMHRKSEVEVV